MALPSCNSFWMLPVLTIGALVVAVLRRPSWLERAELVYASVATREIGYRALLLSISKTDPSEVRVLHGPV